MNLFSNYQKKILKCLKDLEKKKKIKIPSKFNISLEIPPKDQKGDLSCNAAMILANFNKQSPMDLAAILKIHLLILICSLIL